jgi:hypothetical protein
VGKTGFDVFWDGHQLTVIAPSGLSVPVRDIGPGAIGDAPGIYASQSVVPGGGTAIHVRVVSEDGREKVYALWFPSGQDLAPGSALVFDYRNATFAALPSQSDPLPGAFESINLAGDIFSGGADVAFTNLLVTLGVILLLLIGGSLFNEALEENVRGWGIRTLVLPGPIGGFTGAIGAFARRVGTIWAAIIPGATWMDGAIGPAVLLLGTGLIYSLLEPGFGLNEESFTLFVSLVVSQGVLGLAYEGGKSWLYRRSLRVDAGLRLFPACILIALVSVGISRAAGLHPGIVVGFIASAVVLGEPDFTAEERGKAWTKVAAAMLAVSVLAYLLAIPAHQLYEASPNVWTGLPEAIALAIFVVCLQGLLFNLIPLEFMDGWRIWQWKPWAWAALFVPSAFLFVQILFNEDKEYLELVTSHKSIGGLFILLGYIAVTFGTWAYLRGKVEQSARDPDEQAA